MTTRSPQTGSGSGSGTGDATGSAATPPPASTAHPTQPVSLDERLAQMDRKMKAMHQQLLAYQSQTASDFSGAPATARKHRKHSRKHNHAARSSSRKAHKARHAAQAALVAQAARAAQAGVRPNLGFSTPPAPSAHNHHHHHHHHHSHQEDHVCHPKQNIDCGPHKPTGHIICKKPSSAWRTGEVEPSAPPREPPLALNEVQLPRHGQLLASNGEVRTSRNSQSPMKGSGPGPAATTSSPLRVNPSWWHTGTGGWKPSKAPPKRKPRSPPRLAYSVQPNSDAVDEKDEWVSARRSRDADAEAEAPKLESVEAQYLAVPMALRQMYEEQTHARIGSEAASAARERNTRRKEEANAAQKSAKDSRRRQHRKVSRHAAEQGKRRSKHRSLRSRVAHDAASRARLRNRPAWVPNGAGPEPADANEEEFVPELEEKDDVGPQNHRRYKRTGFWAPTESSRRRQQPAQTYVGLGSRDSSPQRISKPYAIPRGYNEAERIRDAAFAAAKAAGRIPSVKADSGVRANGRSRSRSARPKSSKQASRCRSQPRARRKLPVKQHSNPGYESDSGTSSDTSSSSFSSPEHTSRSSRRFRRSHQSSSAHQSASGEATFSVTTDANGDLVVRIHRNDIRARSQSPPKVRVVHGSPSRSKKHKKKSKSHKHSRCAKPGHSSHQPDASAASLLNVAQRAALEGRRRLKAKEESNLLRDMIGKKALGGPSHSGASASAGSASNQQQQQQQNRRQGFQRPNDSNVEPAFQQHWDFRTQGLDGTANSKDAPQISNQALSSSHRRAPAGPIEPAFQQHWDYREKYYSLPDEDNPDEDSTQTSESELEVLQRRMDALRRQVDLAAGVQAAPPTARNSGLQAAVSSAALLSGAMQATDSAQAIGGWSQFNDIRDSDQYVRRRPAQEHGAGVNFPEAPPLSSERYPAKNSSGNANARADERRPAAWAIDVGAGGANNGRGAAGRSHAKKQKKKKKSSRRDDQRDKHRASASNGFKPQYLKNVQSRIKKQLEVDRSLHKMRVQRAEQAAEDVMFQFVGDENVGSNQHRPVQSAWSGAPASAAFAQGSGLQASSSGASFAAAMAAQAKVNEDQTEKQSDIIKERHQDGPGPAWEVYISERDARRANRRRQRTDVQEAAEAPTGTLKHNEYREYAQKLEQQRRRRRSVLNIAQSFLASPLVTAFAPELEQRGPAAHDEVAFSDKYSSHAAAAQLRSKTSNQSTKKKKMKKKKAHRRRGHGHSQRYLRASDYGISESTIQTAHMLLDAGFLDKTSSPSSSSSSSSSSSGSSASSPSSASTDNERLLSAKQQLGVNPVVQNLLSQDDLIASGANVLDQYNDTVSSATAWRPMDQTVAHESAPSSLPWSQDFDRMNQPNGDEHSHPAATGRWMAEGVEDFTGAVGLNDEPSWPSARATRTSSANWNLQLGDEDEDFSAR